MEVSEQIQRLKKQSEQNANMIRELEKVNDLRENKAKGLVVNSNVSDFSNLVLEKNDELFDNGIGFWEDVKSIASRKQNSRFKRD